MKYYCGKCRNELRVDHVDNLGLLLAPCSTCLAAERELGDLDVTNSEITDLEETNESLTQDLCNLREELKKCAVTLKREKRKAYLTGKIEGIADYATWKNGEQFVGALERPLRTVIDPLKRELDSLPE